VASADRKKHCFRAVLDVTGVFVKMAPPAMSHQVDKWWKTNWTNLSLLHCVTSDSHRHGYSMVSDCQMLAQLVRPSSTVATADRKWCSGAVPSVADVLSSSMGCDCPKLGQVGQSVFRDGGSKPLKKLIDLTQHTGT